LYRRRRWRRHREHLVHDRWNPATACRAALQPAQLRDEPRMIQELDAAAIQHRQQVAVNVGLGLVGSEIFDAMHGEALARPQAAISITANRANAKIQRRSRRD
jgi:hypothetical protein